MSKTCTWHQFSIANHLGEPWTPQTWDTESAAQEYLDRQRATWPKGKAYGREPLPCHKVVPVQVTITITE
jgi:hypothetical protein